MRMGPITYDLFKGKLKRRDGAHSRKEEGLVHEDGYMLRGCEVG